MASWHDGSVCSRIDLFESEGLATCLSCGSYRDGPYIYKPLKQKSEMRLLKLHPGEADDPIRGELVIISINTQNYNAVSYTWADQTGDATRCFRAFIGSGYISITRSCQEVLQRIRSRFFTERVWIDSLCIDQDNLQERGHQVQLMPRIYMQAKKTYVYVGPTTSNDESILEALATGIVEHGWSADEEPFWVTLNNFLRRRYFFRVWIIQEIALSRNPVILCGEKEFPWSVLHNDTALKSLPEHLTTRLEDRVISPLLSLGKRGLRYSVELPDLLRLARPCQSTDPRDRVFALLGLVADAEAKNLVADYEQSIPEVFTWIARYLAQVGTAVDVFGNVNMCRDSAGSESPLGFQNELQLPSWVPDWTNAGTTCLDLFPKARTYLESLPLSFNEFDMRQLVLSGFEFKYTYEHRILDRSNLKNFGAAMFVRRYEPLPRFILFQGGQETTKWYSSGQGKFQWSLPQYLIILAPVIFNPDEDSEVPGWKDFDDFGKNENGDWDNTFRFLGLLQVRSRLHPDEYTRSDLFSIKVV